MTFRLAVASGITNAQGASFVLGPTWTRPADDPTHPGSPPKRGIFPAQLAEPRRELMLQGRFWRPRVAPPEILEPRVTRSIAPAREGRIHVALDPS